MPDVLLAVREAEAWQPELWDRATNAGEPRGWTRAMHEGRPNRYPPAADASA